MTVVKSIKYVKKPIVKIILCATYYFRHHFFRNITIMSEIFSGIVRAIKVIKGQT